MAVDRAQSAELLRLKPRLVETAPGATYLGTLECESGYKCCYLTSFNIGPSYAWLLLRLYGKAWSEGAVTARFISKNAYNSSPSTNAPQGVNPFNFSIVFSNPTS